MSELDDLLAKLRGGAKGSDPDVVDRYPLTAPDALDRWLAATRRVIDDALSNPTTQPTNQDNMMGIMLGTMAATNLGATRLSGAGSAAINTMLGMALTEMVIRGEPTSSITVEGVEDVDPEEPSVHRQAMTLRLAGRIVGTVTRYFTYPSGLKRDMVSGISFRLRPASTWVLPDKGMAVAITKADTGPVDPSAN